jgi:hypothetical protein
MFRLLADSGRAWLEVPLAEAKRVGLKISPYSRQSGKYLYLEQDIDAPAFLRLYADIRYEEGDNSWIRQLPRFRKT